MPRPTTRATKPGRGRPKASPESCAPAWYAKRRPATTLKNALARLTPANRNREKVVSGANLNRNVDAL